MYKIIMVLRATNLMETDSYGQWRAVVACERAH